MLRYSLRPYHITLSPVARPTCSKILAPPLGDAHLRIIETFIRNLHWYTWPKLCSLISRLCLKVYGTRNLHEIEPRSNLCHFLHKFLVHVSWACDTPISNCFTHNCGIALMIWYGILPQCAVIVILPRSYLSFNVDTRIRLFTSCGKIPYHITVFSHSSIFSCLVLKEKYRTTKC